MPLPERVFCCLPLLIAAFVSSSGSSSAQSNLETLLSAPTEVVVDGMPVQVETEAYLNLMPGSIADTELNEGCSRSNRLIVPVDLQVLGGMASTPALSADSVWVVGENFVWNDVLRDERRQDEIQVARGCPNTTVKPGTPVRVVVKVVGSGEAFYLRSLQEEIGAVF